MTQYYIFNYLNDYEEPIAASRIIKLAADFNRADGINTLKLENGDYLTSLRDGRFYNSQEVPYARSYSYNLDNICYFNGYVRIG